MFVSVMEGGNLHHPVNPSSALSTKVLATLRVQRCDDGDDDEDDDEDDDDDDDDEDTRQRAGCQKASISILRCSASLLLGEAYNTFKKNLIFSA